MPAQQRRKGTARPAEATKIQDRPAEPAPPKARVLDPANRDGDFLPNPAKPKKAQPNRPTMRYMRVTGPKKIWGVAAPGWLKHPMTDGAFAALLSGGHVEDWTGEDGQPKEGWGVDPEPEPEEQPPAEDEGDSPNEEGN